MEFPIYKMRIDENDEGVQYVSLVEHPATEINYLAFSKSKMLFSENAEKRILTGLLMAANTPILRQDKERGKYYVIFEPDVIEKMVMRFFKQNNIRNVNVEHKLDVEGVYMFESWITNQARGINAPNEFADTPDGSWFGSYKIENDDVWENRDKFGGFSIEGYFGLEPVDDDNQEQAIENFLSALNEFLATNQSI